MLVLVLRFGQHRHIVISGHRAPQNIGTITLFSLGSIEKACIGKEDIEVIPSLNFSSSCFISLPFFLGKYTLLLYPFYKSP